MILGFDGAILSLEWKEAYGTSSSRTGKHNHPQPKPRTQAEIARFVKAIQHTDPTLKAEGDLTAERRKGLQSAAPATCDGLDFAKK